MSAQERLDRQLAAPPVGVVDVPEVSKADAALARLEGVSGPSHIVNGQFQSDKYPTCPPGKVPLSVNDTTAQDLLWAYAQRRRVVDPDFSEDLETALLTAGFTPSVAGGCDCGHPGCSVCDAASAADEQASESSALKVERDEACGELVRLRAHLASLPAFFAPVPPGDRRPSVAGGECSACPAPAGYHEADCPKRTAGDGERVTEAELAEAARDDSRPMGQAMARELVALRAEVTVIKADLMQTGELLLVARGEVHEWQTKCNSAWFEGAAIDAHSSLREIGAERDRQIEKWGDGAPSGGFGGPVLMADLVQVEAAKRRCEAAMKAGTCTMRDVLEEEVAEVFAENPGSARQRAELVQVAAVCVKWIELIDRDGAK